MTTLYQPPSSPIEADADDESPAIGTVLRPQAMLFTLYGDYILARGGRIWTGSLIRLFNLFGFSEQAVRSALSRMARNGWLQVEREGKRSYYSLTESGRDLLQSGSRRIFGTLV